MFRRLSSRLTVAVAVAALGGMGLTSGHTTQASTSLDLASLVVAGNPHPVHVSVVPGSTFPEVSGTTYAYAEEGMCPGAGGGAVCDTTDNIEVWKISGSGGTLIQTLPTTNQYYSDTTGHPHAAFFGSNWLAYDKKLDCVIVANEGNSGGADTTFAGSWESYAVDKSTEKLTLVSNVPDPNDGSGHGPSSVQVVDTKSGAWVIGSDSFPPSTYGNTLESLPLSSGCKLGNVKQSTGGSGSEGYLNFTIVSPTRVVANDVLLTTEDTYALNDSTGALTLVKEAAGDGVTPDGIFVSGSNLFTGVLGGPPAEVTSGKYTSASGNVTWDPTSPGKDSSSNATYAVPVWYDKSNHIVTGGDERNSAGTGNSLLSNFKIGPGTKITFANETSLAVPSQLTNDLQPLGTGLFLTTIYNGDNELCSEGASGPTNCKTVFTMTNPNGSEEVILASS
ncbi:MAG TPA: hypothetical protein VKX16_04930 [Chloroflexota bacterium]|nr:hypothetical protein [Chloroflexota bacterium]